MHQAVVWHVSVQWITLYLTLLSTTHQETQDGNGNGNGDAMTPSLATTCLVAVCSANTAQAFSLLLPPKMNVLHTQRTLTHHCGSRVNEEVQESETASESQQRQIEDIFVVSCLLYKSSEVRIRTSSQKTQKIQKQDSHLQPKDPKSHIFVFTTCTFLVLQCTHTHSKHPTKMLKTRH